MTLEIVYIRARDWTLRDITQLLRDASGHYALPLIVAPKGTMHMGAVYTGS